MDPLRIGCIVAARLELSASTIPGPAMVGVACDVLNAATYLVVTCRNNTISDLSVYWMTIACQKTLSALSARNRSTRAISIRFRIIYQVPTRSQRMQRVNADFIIGEISPQPVCCSSKVRETYFSNLKSTGLSTLRLSRSQFQREQFVKLILWRYGLIDLRGEDLPLTVNIASFCGTQKVSLRSRSRPPDGIATSLYHLRMMNWPDLKN